jgi:hypothetical protein
VSRAVAAIVALAWLAACSPSPEAPGAASPAEEAMETAWTLSAEGYGPIQIGMTADEASVAFGSPLLANGEPHPEACESYTLEPGIEPQGMRFLSIDGRLARMTDHGSETIATSRAITFGASAAEVRAAYPDAVEEPIKDEDSPAHTLTSLEPPNERGIRFHISAQGAVAGITVGTPDALLLTEGCS